MRKICTMSYEIMYSFLEGRGSEYDIKNTIWNCDCIDCHGGGNHVCGGVLLKDIENYGWKV